MFRYTVAVWLAFGVVGAASAGSWADGMFEELSRDFGSVPRGPTLTHSFRFTNTTGQPVHIAGVRVSCGCVSASATQADVAPGQTSSIYAQMDTRRFSGVKTVTVYVQFDRPQWEEVRLWVQANGRDDVTLTPEALAFGQAKRGSAPTAAVDVVLLGNGDWKILDAQCDSNYVQPKIEEVRRGPAEVAYRVTARVRPDTPVGKWYTDVWLRTNNPATPRVRVPLTIEIESPLSVSPFVANLGQVKAGTEVERKVIVRGVKPFRITEVKGVDGQLRVQEATTDSKPVHVLTVKLKAADAGELSRTLRVLTDLKEDGEVEFKAIAQVVPQ